MPIFQSQLPPLSKSSSAKLIFKKYWFYSLPIILLLVTIGLGLYLKSSQDSRRSADNNNQLAGYVYFDRNKNNQRDASAEAGPWLAAVVLYNQAGQEVKRTYTNQQGFFKFINVDNTQTYKLRAEHPKNHDGSQNSSTYYANLPSYYVDNVSAGYSYNIKVTEGDVWYYDIRPELLWPAGAPALASVRPDPGTYASRSNWNMNDYYTGASGIFFCDSTSVASVGYNFSSSTNAPDGKLFCGLYKDTNDGCANNGDCFSPIGWSNSIAGGSQVTWEAWHSFAWEDVAPVNQAANIADWHNYATNLNNVIKPYLQSLASGKKAYVGILLLGGSPTECRDLTPQAIRAAAGGSQTVACGTVPLYNSEWTQYYAHFVRELTEWAWDDSSQGLGADLRNKLAGWVIPTGFYGETITGGGLIGGDFSNFLYGWNTYQRLHWINYGTGNNDIGSFGRIVPNSNPITWYFGNGWDTGFQPNAAGSAASVLAIWDRWAKKPIHIFNTAANSSFYISEFAKAAYFHSNRGPIGMRQHGWAWTVPTHHSGTGEKFKTDAFGQADIWKNAYMEAVGPGGSSSKIWNSAGQSQVVPAYQANGSGINLYTGYLPFAVSGVEHFYAGNPQQTYKSWLWLAANGIQNQDTSSRNYIMLGKYVDTHPRITWADSFWAWINKMYQLDSDWVATLRFFQIGSPMQRAESIYNTISWQNNSQSGARGAKNDWVKQVSDAYEYDMAITTGINLINRCSDKGGTPGDTADTCFTAAPAHLYSSSSPNNILFGIGSFAEINFTASQNLVEFQPFAYPERIPEWKLKTGDSVAIYLVMANFKHNLKIYYGREGAWGQPWEFNSLAATQDWQIYQFSGTYHPDNVIRIEANNANGSSYKDYIHLAIFQEQWSDSQPANPLPTGDQGEPPATNTPVQTNPVTPTPTNGEAPVATPVPRICNQSCDDATAPCAAPMVCIRETSGYYRSHCRLPGCLDDENCSCGTVPTNVPIIPTATVTPTVPDSTGIPTQPTATDVPTVPTVPAATQVPTVPTIPAATDVPAIPTATTQPIIPISNTIVPIEPTTPEDTTEVVLYTKLDGVPLCEEAGCFALTSAGDNISVQVTLQNTFDVPITQKILFSFDAANKTYVSAGPLTYKNLTPGPYFIILKGPKHLATRYCYYDSDTTQSCLISDLINVTLNYTKDQALVNKFIYLEPGMSYRLDLSHQPMIAGDLPISGSNKNEQDGKVDTIDYSFILGCLKNQTEASCVQRGDINFTGEVNNLDLNLLRQALMQAADQL